MSASSELASTRSVIASGSVGEHPVPVRDALAALVRVVAEPDAVPRVPALAQFHEFRRVERVVQRLFPRVAPRLGDVISDQGLGVFPVTGQHDGAGEQFRRPVVLVFPRPIVLDQINRRLPGGKREVVLVGFLCRHFQRDLARTMAGGFDPDVMLEQESLYLRVLEEVGLRGHDAFQRDGRPERQQGITSGEKPQEPDDADDGGHHDSPAIRRTPESRLGGEY